MKWVQIQAQVRDGGDFLPEASGKSGSDEILKREFDFLVVGSGVAGLSFALEAAGHGSVCVVTKDRLPEGSSQYAQGGVATVWGPEDSFSSHAQDTTLAGGGLCRSEIVDLVVREGPQRVREMIARGTRFSLRPDAADAYDVDLSLEGGHSQRRILHALDATGREMMRTLVEAVHAEPQITVLEKQIAVDLIQTSKFGLPGPERCCGAYLLDLDSERIDIVAARATLLATGGAAKVYLYTSNPDVASGDGVAMAYRAGVPIANMEFMQFHPTCLYHPRAKSFLVSETVRGEGGRLLLPNGERFMPAHDERAELAPRDVVARAIDHEMKLHGLDHVLLDVTHCKPDFLEERFPTILRRCRALGIDPVREPMPVVPAAHYTCGGVLTDGDGRTALPGLYAAGEVAMTGLHGANRLASNSLLEGLVFGHRAARHAVSDPGLTGGVATEIPPWNPGRARNGEEAVLITQNWEEIRRLMWNYVGIVRSDRRLARARQRMELVLDEIQRDYWDFLPTADLIELRNLATVADLIIVSASQRRESRGLHFNLDCPRTDPARARDTIVVRHPTLRRPVPLDDLG